LYILAQDKRELKCVINQRKVLTNTIDFLQNVNKEYKIKGPNLDDCGTTNRKIFYNLLKKNFSYILK